MSIELNSPGFVVFLLAAYVIGATPFGVIVAKLHGVDLRKAGSGNVGATNVGRVLGRGWGYLCFLLDVAKGFAPAMVFGMGICADLAPGQAPDAPHQLAWLAIGGACILGHVLSFWLKFRGGKGVATSLGVVLGMYPYFTWAGVGAFAVWVAVVLRSRYVSLASIVAALAFLPIFVAVNVWTIGWDATLQLWPMGAFAAVMGALVIFRHRTNVKRLLAGTENKIGKKIDARPDA
jgi:glycerol-3-phosphate acyltransferase PlsY